MRNDGFFQPVSALEMPRFAGMPSFMRLPHLTLESQEITRVDIGLVGVPWDAGTTNRPGPRHGPRQLRDLSTMIRALNPVTGINPFELVNCADLGDVGPNPIDLQDSLDRIMAFYAELKQRRITPMTAGGDHLVSLPVLRGLASDRPLAMIHFDSHTDLFDSYFGGFKYTHGTPFRRAIEEGLLDPKHVVQIGIRGTAYNYDDIEWGESQGVRIIRIEELFDRGITAVMDEARAIVGDRPTYCSFDIDLSTQPMHLVPAHRKLAVQMPFKPNRLFGRYAVLTWSGLTLLRYRRHLTHQVAPLGSACHLCLN